jgi:hypothetical protein
MAGLLRAHHPLGDLPDAGDVGHAGAAIFLYDDGPLL